ncbi:MAG: hypothetical protein ACRYGP_01225 [Janthinobacterium lividum]
MKPALTSRLSQFTLPILSAIAVIVPRAVQAESLNAVVSFVEVVNQAGSSTKLYGQPRILDLSVIDGTHVSDRDARRQGQSNERAHERTGVIGTPIQIQDTFMVWRLEGPKTVVRETNFPTFIETITITFHSGGCDATVAYRLMPSSRYYYMQNLNTGVDLPFTSLGGEFIHCSLGAAAVS